MIFSGNTKLGKAARILEGRIKEKTLTVWGRVRRGRMKRNRDWCNILQL